MLYCERIQTQYTLVDAIRVATGQNISSKFQESFQKCTGNILPLYNPSHNIAPSHKLLLIDAVFDDVHPLFAVISCCAGYCNEW